MSDDVTTSATIARLRAEVGRLTLESEVLQINLNSAIDSMIAACAGSGCGSVNDLRQALEERREYIIGLLAENVRLSNEAAELRAGIEDARRYCAVVQGHWDTARERAGVLEAEVRAWRHHDDVHECEPESERLMHRSVAAHDEACRAAQETDRTHALDAAKFGGAT